MIPTYDELWEAVLTYFARAVEKKMRRGQSICSCVHVFVGTNQFRVQDAQ
jgi:hypothetical protein